MKKCSKCKEEKPLEKFYRDKSGKDGRKSYCKECSKRYRENNREKLREYQKQWYENNREKIIEQQKQYRDNNKEKVREKNKQYFKNNKEKIYERQKQYRENNKEKFREYKKQYYENNKEKERERQKQYRENNRERERERSRQYYENNKEKERERQKQYQSQRRKNDPKYRLSNNISRAFRRFLKGNKEKLTSEYLKQCEYTRKELVKHLEDQFDQNMNWDNYGSYWHVDHIIPQSVFEPTNEQHLKWCWSLENLRPLEASENASKQDDIILEEVEKISYYEDVKHLLKD